MGGLMGGAPKVQGPSAEEIALKKKIADDKIKADALKAEEVAQHARNKRGKRSLLSDENTGAGFSSTLGG